MWSVGQSGAASTTQGSGSAKVVSVKSETYILIPSTRIPTAMGSEAAPSPRDACLRITLDANSLYSNIRALVL